MGKQHPFGVTLPLKFMVSPLSHVNSPRALCTERTVASTHKVPQVAAITVTSRWSLSVWLDDALPPHSGVSLCDPWGAHRRPLHPVRPSCKFSHCFEPKMGILVLCRRCVPSLSRRPQSLENRCHLPEC